MFLLLNNNRSGSMPNTQINILFHAALARLIAVSDALKWKGSFLKSVD